MAHVMTLELDGLVVEVHMLNAGDRLPYFGGSKSGLVVQKTASIVTRSKGSGGCKDVEYDIYDASVWKWIDELINWHGAKVVSVQPCEDQSDKPQAA